MNDDNLLQAKEEITKREDQVARLNKLLETAKLCAELGHFDMASKLLGEFDGISKKEP
jgi:hypothetical protein